MDIAGVRESAGNSSSAGPTALCGVQFVDVLGVTVVVTALPRMLEDLATRRLASCSQHTDQRRGFTAGTTIVGANRPA
jgi:hypothetical protein